MTNVNIVKIYPDVKTPTRGSSLSAGYDLCAYIPGHVATKMINPHSTVKIGTGLKIQPPQGYFGAIFARSGLATKQGLRPSNCVGVCDEDYTGEYIVAIHNDTDEVKYISHGDRIAQLVFLPYVDVTFKEVDTLNETERGSNGFGSTDK